MSGLIKGYYQTTPDTYASGDVVPVQVDANGKLVTTATMTLSPLAADNVDGVAASATVDKQVSISRLTGWNGTGFDRIRTSLPTADAKSAVSAGLAVSDQGYVFNSSTWDRTRSVGIGDSAAPTGILAAGLILRSPSGDTYDRARSHNPADLATAPVISMPASSFPHRWNGSSWDRVRNNNDGLQLASAARTVTTATALITNHNNAAALIVCNVTVNPGASETLQIVLQAKDPVAVLYDDAYAGTAYTLSGGTGRIYLLVGPGAADAFTMSTADTKQGHIARQFRVNVVHSASGSWTYALGVTLLN